MSEFLSSPEKVLPLAAAAMVLLALGLEALVTRGRTYDRRDTAANFAMYAGYLAIGAVWLPVVYSIFVSVHDRSLFKIGEGWQLGEASWWAWALIFVADDFCYYWFHRLSHRWFWFSHVSHHSSEHFNLSTAFRQTWLPYYAFIFWLPLAFIGFEPLMILTMQLLSLTIQGFLHTQLIKTFGPLDFIFNTPSHHRVHHGSQPKYVDRNFGGVLIVWDRLFGTFQREEEKPVYGIGEPTSYNPFKIAFGPMTKIFVLILFFSTGCQAQMQAWQRDRTVTRLSKIESYHGRFTETGLQEKPGTSEIWFQAPTSYTIVADDGSFLVSEPGTLKMFDPQTHIAVTVKNLPGLTPASAREALAEQFDEDVKLFKYSLGPYSKVAGLETIELRFEGRGLVKKGTSQVYDPYAFPLSTELKFPDASYALKFSSIEFNKSTRPPVKAIPQDAIVSEWDYNSKAFTVEQAQKEISFTPPKTDLPLLKMIRQKGPIPAFTAFYAKGSRTLSVLIYKSYGVPADPRGIKVAGGRLRPGPHLSSFAISRGETNYIYTFTGPLDQVNTYAN